MLNDRVLPFFEEHGVPLLRILTDRGSAYCGNRESHEFALYRGTLENIRAHSESRGQEPAVYGSGACHSSRRVEPGCGTTGRDNALGQVLLRQDAAATFIEERELAYDKQLDRMQLTSEPAEVGRRRRRLVCQISLD
jgi:hypothetical protein